MNAAARRSSTAVQVNMNDNPTGAINSFGDLFDMAVLAVVSQATDGADRIHVNGVLRLVETKAGHGFELPIPDWQQRTTVALLHLQSQGLLRADGGMFVATESGAQIASEMERCGSLMNEIRAALIFVGLNEPQPLVG